MIVKNTSSHTQVIMLCYRVLKDISLAKTVIENLKPSYKNAQQAGLIIRGLLKEQLS